MASRGDYPLALTAWCGECGTWVGAKCRTLRGQEKRFPHSARLRRAKSLQRGTARASHPGEQGWETSIEMTQEELRL